MRTLLTTPFLCLLLPFNSQTGDLTYKLPGHRGSVNEVVFHPTEPIIASCSNDKSIYLGELAQ